MMFEERKAFPGYQVNSGNPIGAITLKTIVHFHAPNELTNTRKASRTVIFDPDFWEKELIWQAVGLIVKEFNIGPEIAIEALQSALERLSRSDEVLF